MIRSLLRLATLCRRMDGKFTLYYDLEPRRLVGAPKRSWSAWWSCEYRTFEVSGPSLAKVIDELVREVENYYANHWRDDDTPEFECGYGTC